MDLSKLIKFISITLLICFTFCTGKTYAASLGKDQKTDIQSKVSFADSFDDNTINKYRYFKYFDECFAVEKNHLVLDIKGNKKCLLNIRPIVGENSKLQLSLKWPKHSSSRFQLYYDYRYNLHDEFGVIIFSSKKKKIFYRDHNRKWKSIDFPFKRDKWISFALVRKKSEVTLYSNGKKLFSTSIREKKKATNIQEHIKYGGFAIGLDKRNFAQLIHLDNISIEGDKAPIEMDVLQENFLINNKQYTFQVIHETGYEDWAQYQLKASIPYIQRLADFYSVPPVQEYMGIVQARGKYYFKGYGVNAKKGIISRWPKKNEYLDSHELVHNWGYLYRKEWLEEGAANLPRALFKEIDSKELMRINYKLTENQKNDFSNWMNNIYIDDNKAGWEGDMPTDRTNIFYWKATVLHRIIYRILGNTRYKLFHKKIYAAGGSIETEDFKSIFKEITGKSADQLLRGWVYEGTGEYCPSDAIKDNDKDGLNNLEEQLYGTNSNNIDSDNDGFSDFEEMRLGFNPLNKSEPGDQYLITDGIIQDWEKIKTIFIDAKGDSKNDPESFTDIKAIKVYGDKINNKFYLLVLFHNQFQIKEGARYWLQIQLDLDGDGKLDNRVIYWLPARKTRIISKFGMTGSPEETGRTNRYLSSKGAEIYYGNHNDQGFIEATFPLEHFATEIGSGITIEIKGGSDAFIDSADQNPLSIKMDNIYNLNTPSKVFIPEILYQ